MAGVEVLRARFNGGRLPIRVRIGMMGFDEADVIARTESTLTLRPAR